MLGSVSVVKNRKIPGSSIGIDTTYSVFCSEYANMLWYVSVF